jgi:hypothetical protein
MVQVGGDMIIRYVDQIPPPTRPYTLAIHFFLHRLRVLLDELDTLLNVLLEVSEALVQQTLLVLGQLAHWVDLLNTVWAKLDLAGEELDALVLVERAVDKGWLDDTLLALSSLEQALGETGTGHGHGESGRSSTVLGLDDLVTTELDAVDELVELLAADVGVVGLRKQGDDGDTRVTTNDGDSLVGWVGALEFRDEARGTDHVEGGDTEQALWVVDALGLEDLGDNWDSRVDLEERLATRLAGCCSQNVRG